MKKPKNLKIKDQQTSALELKKFLNSIPDDQLEYCRILLQLPKYSTNRFIVAEVQPEEAEPGKLMYLTLVS